MICIKDLERGKAVCLPFPETGKKILKKNQKKELLLEPRVMTEKPSGNPRNESNLY